MSIPIANPQISEAAKEAVCDVLDSGMLADGEVVRKFESEFADFVGTEYAVATCNGTAALQVMLEAAGIGEGDVVLTTPFSFIATANAIRHTGAEVAFADVRSDTYNLDPRDVRAVLEECDNVTALMPVHLYGLPAAMDTFRALAEDYDILLFEDAAQAHGAKYGGQMVGSIGKAGAFSFYPTKNMTTGEGGMVTTDDRQLVERIRRLINHGRTGEYEHSEIGYNYRMTNIQAAIGRSQLERLPEWVKARRSNAEGLIQGLNQVTDVTTPVVPDDRKHAYHQFTVTTKKRNKLRSALEGAEIGYGIYYPKPITDQASYKRENQFSITNSLCQTVLSLPVHPYVEENDIRNIVSVAADIN
jgi:dTDP-4-amino-4,6-dideoxygalactose transaminase